MEAATVVALRRAGWTPAQIVIESQTSPGDVAAALGARGTGVRSWTLPTLVRAVTWAEWRRGGQRVTRIADREGVSHQWVSTLTRPFGPYPRPDDPVQQWVADRRAGQRLATIAGDYQVSVDRVSKATAPHGPFPYPHPPQEGLSTYRIARMFDVAEPTVRRWQTRSDFPDPLSGSHPPRWATNTISAWAATHLTTCPACGARVLHLARHRRARRH